MMHILAFSVAFLFPLFALAHTRWFAEGELPPLADTESSGFYLSIFAAAAIAIASVGIGLERRRALQFGALSPKKPHSFERAASTFTMVAGTFFLIAGTHEYLFSPNLTIHGGVPSWMVFLQIFIGLSFLVGAFPRLSSLVLAALWGVGFSYFGFTPMIENIWVISTAVFTFFMGNDYFALFSNEKLDSVARPFKKYALSVLRVGTGATLVILGFTEKILHPEYGVNFLAQHHWNFFAEYGMSDYLFTLLAGSVEVLLGAVFILGVVTRLNALVVAIFFTIPLFILGPIELAGHLPHFAAVVLLLLFGSGRMRG